MKARDLPSVEFQADFYPTPPEVAAKLTKDIDWNQVKTVLEPSAGRGDLAEFVGNALAKSIYRNKGKCNIDCIEIDETLRAVLKGKEFRVVHDDFMSFEALTYYDLIIMNPPFSKGAEHLSKALSMIESRGGSIACILNAETIRNPCSNLRKDLVSRLTRLGAQIEYWCHAFSEAERATDVEIAVVRVTIEPNMEDSILLDALRTAHDYAEEPAHMDSTQVSQSELIQAIINKYHFESNVGCMMLSEYKKARPYMLASTGEYAKPILELEVDGDGYRDVNCYLDTLRRKYWSALFQNPAFMKNMTSNIRDEMQRRVSQLGAYDFSTFNILEIQSQMRGMVLEGIKSTILSLFEDWTHRHTYHDGSGNVHYYNGWKTNNAFAVNKKVVIPFYESVWRRWDGKFSPTDYAVVRKLSDIQMVFDYLSGEMPDSSGVVENLRAAEQNGYTTKIPLKYFRVTFYKKGTTHVEFTNMEVLYRFNLFAARNKMWLPPCYGKKHYRDMNQEEKDVIDSFEGEKSYEQTMETPERMVGDSILEITAGAI